MKKVLIVVLVLVLFASCNIPQGQSTNISIGVSTIKVYNFYGCEYLGKLNDSNSDFLTHKGDCNNPIHTREN